MNEKYPTEIPFTQYMRPWGRTETVFFDASKETHALATALIAKGYHFEAEVLLTDEVAFSVTNGEEDIVIKLCRNGPGIEKHVDALVKEADDVVKRL